MSAALRCLSYGNRYKTGRYYAYLYRTYDATAMFLNRTPALALLQCWWDGDQRELLTLYGRRQVGKTSLLARFTADKAEGFVYLSSLNSRGLLYHKLYGDTTGNTSPSMVVTFVVVGHGRHQHPSRSGTGWCET